MKHFNFMEFIHTDTGICNIPKDFDTIVNIVKLAEWLDGIREEFGEPIVVNSAFRTKDVNTAVGGAEKSWHLSGLAADIRPSTYHAYDYRYALERLNRVLQRHADECNELIYYPTFTHVAIKHG